MSRSVPLAEVTASLQKALSGTAPSITARPPGTARDGVNGDQINLFLYSVLPEHAHAAANPATGLEASLPSGHFELKYLVTAYSDDSDAAGQNVLGRVIGSLSNHPLLDLSGVQSLKKVSVTIEDLPPGELAALWTSLRAEYRLSVSYEVRVQLA